MGENIEAVLVVSKTVDLEENVGKLCVCVYVCVCVHGVYQQNSGRKLRLKNS